MFAQLKQLLPEKWPYKRFDPENISFWRGLKIGYSLQFGSVGQRELSRRILRISAIKQYAFPQADFIAYGLSRKSDPLYWMIVADDGEGSAPYFALSRELSTQELQVLFTKEDLKILSHSSRLKHLFVRGGSGGLSDWVTGRYSRKIEGLRATQRFRGVERVFEYELYTSEDNSHAVEIERFLDGHMKAFATIYCDVDAITDVIFSAPRSDELAAERSAKPVKTNGHDTLEALPKLKLEHRDIAETRKKLKESKAEKDDDTLECDIKTAQFLIEEALSSDIRLADVIRKILGLPIVTSEALSFKLGLSDDEYDVLAKRFSLDATNKQAIRKRITEELKAFSGNGN